MASLCRWTQGRANNGNAGRGGPGVSSLAPCVYRERRPRGLLGRPVKLIYYDDQTNPSLVPAIYAKLFDVDKIDLVLTSYGTNLSVPSMPVVISRNYVLLGLFALAANSEFNYPYYFSMFPGGPEAAREFSRGYFEIAKEQRLQTVAIAGTDSEFAKKATDGARENAPGMGFKIVYDRGYPPNTVDFTPIVRGIQASDPDIVYFASAPTETVGIVRAANEIGLKTKLFGGSEVRIPPPQRASPSPTRHI